MEKGEPLQYLVHNIIIQGLLVQTKALKSSKLCFSYVNIPPYTPQKNVKYSWALSEESYEKWMENLDGPKKKISDESSQGV